MKLQVGVRWQGYWPQNVHTINTTSRNHCVQIQHWHQKNANALCAHRLPTVFLNLNTGCNILQTTQDAFPQKINVVFPFFVSNNHAWPTRARIQKWCFCKTSIMVSRSDTAFLIMIAQQVANKKNSIETPSQFTSAYLCWGGWMQGASNSLLKDGSVSMPGFQAVGLATEKTTMGAQWHR